LKNKKILQIVIVVVMIVVLVGGVVFASKYGTNPQKEPSTELPATPEVKVEVPTPDEANQTTITLKQGATEITGGGAGVTGNTVSINKGGTYLVSGKLEEGRIQILAGPKDTVVLVLAGVDISHSEDAVIHSKSEGHLSVQLKDGTDNKLQSGTTETLASKEEVSNLTVKGAALDVNGELSLAGTGKLQVNGYINNGIKSKKNLMIKEGTIDIESKGDALQTDMELTVAGGTFTVVAGGGSQDVTFSSERGFGKADSNWDMTAEDTPSTKGIKSIGNMIIGGGTFDINAKDDAFHSDAEIAISGGELSVESGDDGVRAGTKLQISGGKLNVNKSYEGLEAIQVIVEGGEANIVSADDGVNAYEGQNNIGGTAKTTEVAPEFYVKGGKLYINANGDGVDSNGNIIIEGGVTVVDGPTNSGNGAIDSGSENGGSIVVNGGTFLAVGSSGMAEGFGDSSKQPSFLHVLDNSYNEGTEIIVSDSTGKELYKHTAAKTGNCVIFSSADLKQGEKYTLKVGEQKAEISMDSIAQSNGGGHRMGGDRPGGMDDAMKKPDGEKPRDIPKPQM